jgi:hypothetical protein
MMGAAAYTVSNCRINREIMTEPQIPQISEFREYRRKWKHHVDRMSCDRIPKTDFKIPTRRKRKPGMTSEMMERVFFVIFVTSLTQ